MAKQSKTSKGKVKKAIKRKPNSEKEEAGSTSYSTRFDPRQRELIETAAKELNVTPAKFIRECAVTQAAYVVNASGNSRVYLRNLARIVAKQILDPEVEYEQILVGEHPDEETKQRVKKGYLQVQRSGMEEPPDWYEAGYGERIKDPRPVRPHESELKQIVSAFETSGSEFLGLILEEWKSKNSDNGSYSPKISLESVLAPNDQEE